MITKKQLTDEVLFLQEENDLLKKQVIYYKEVIREASGENNRNVYKSKDAVSSQFYDDLANNEYDKNTANTLCDLESIY